jgi:hypothetical protein
VSFVQSRVGLLVHRHARDNLGVVEAAAFVRRRYRLAVARNPSLLSGKSAATVRFRVPPLREIL